MKLNPECVRDILLYLEENNTLIHHNSNEKRIQHKEISIFELAEIMLNEYNYEYDEALYAIEKLMEIGYVKYGGISTGSGHSIIFGNIYDITYQGHNFLNTIRSQSIWKATVSGAKKIGSMSIHTLTTLSMEIMKAIVTNPAVIQNIIQNMSN